MGSFVVALGFAGALCLGLSITELVLNWLEPAGHHIALRIQQEDESGQTSKKGVLWRKSAAPVRSQDEMSRLFKRMEKLSFRILKVTHAPIVETIPLYVRSYVLVRAFTWLLVIGGTLTLLLLFSGQPLAAALFLPLLFLGAGAYLNKRVEKFKNDFSSQFLIFTEGTASALASGYSLLQAMQRAGKTSSGSLSDFLTSLYSEVALGSSVEQAFVTCARRYKQTDLTLLATSLRISQRMGGNTKKLFEEHAAKGRARIIFIQSLKSQTAQGRLSTRLVGIVPLFLLGILNLLMPGYFDYFFASSSGQSLFAVAIFLNVLGFLLVAKLTKVRFA